MAPTAAGPAREEKDVLKILVASDMHLGYGERDPIRASSLHSHTNSPRPRVC